MEKKGDKRSDFEEIKLYRGRDENQNGNGYFFVGKTNQINNRSLASDKEERMSR